MPENEPCGKVLVRWSNWSLCFLEAPDEEPDEEWLERRDLRIPDRLNTTTMLMMMIAVKHIQPSAISKTSHQSLKI